MLFTVFKTLLLHFKAEFALEAAPLHATVKHEPLALRAATPVSRSVQNSLCNMIRARINEITFLPISRIRTQAKEQMDLTLR